jgi:hypothetical protein
MYYVCVLLFVMCCNFQFDMECSAACLVAAGWSVPLYARGFWFQIRDFCFYDLFWIGDLDTVLHMGFSGTGRGG